MQDNLINRLLLGGLFIIIGIVIIIFHEYVRNFNDKINSVLLGDMWTGKYSRGGLLFIRVASIIFGAFWLVIGILILTNVLP
jgi:hypothetical protein